MSAVNALEDALLSLIFENANSGLNIGDATGLRGSTTAGNAHISLHTATLAETDNAQTTSETAYTNYARQAVARDAASWDVASGNASNAQAITFATCGVTGSTIAAFGIGSAASSTGNLWFKGTCSLTVSTGVAPQFAIGALDVSLD